MILDLLTWGVQHGLVLAWFAIPEVAEVALGGGAEAAGGAAEAGAAGEAGEAAEGAEAEGAEEDDDIEKADRRKGRGKQAHKDKHVEVTKTKDRLDELLKALKEFTKEEVLVGIASDTAQRQDGGPINNATIGMIMEMGSPAANIPARPWLVPGIYSARKEIMGTYLLATLRAFKNFNAQPIHSAHDRVGSIARDAVKKYIKTAAFTPLAASTVAARFRQRKAKRRRKSETQYLSAVAGGMAPSLAEAKFGIQPLINTGTFLNSVTYAVREKSDKSDAFRSVG